MKLHSILTVLLVVAGLVGVGLTYQFGIKPRLDSYAELVAEEKVLRARINELAERFSRSRPQEVVGAWRQQVQPWTDAASTRIPYFDTAPEYTFAKVPEEEKDFPKFWYIDKRAELLQGLEDEAEAAGCVIPNEFPFEPPDAEKSGWKPDIFAIEKAFADFEYGAEYVRIAFQAKATRLINFSLWQPEQLVTTPEGSVFIERAGYTMDIQLEDLVHFMDSIERSSTHAAIESFAMQKLAPEDPASLMRVDFIFAQSRFVPAVVQVAESGKDVVLRRRAARGGGGGRGIGQGKRGQQNYSEEELERIRAQVRGQTDPNFFQSVLRWFGIGG